MPESDSLDTLNTYFDLMVMNGGVRVFQAAQQHGLLEALSQQPNTAEGLADFCRLQREPTRLLLESLCSLDLVVKDDECYGPAPVLKLLAGDYQGLGDVYWDHLSSYLQTGKPLVRMDDPQQSEALYKKQALGLYWMMKPSAAIVADKMQIGTLRSGLKILDVGAGSAVWSLSMLAQDVDSSVTALDWPAVASIGQSLAGQMGLSAKFSILAGNYHEVPLDEEAYDLAIIGNVTHLETEAGNRELFEKVFRALSPGGEVLIVDIFSGQSAGNMQRTLYALGLALRTEHGTVHEQGLLTSLLQDSGFIDITFEPLPAPPFTMGMLVGKKAAN